jgi:hypothetical protein
MSGLDLNHVSRNDKGLIGAGIVAFIASFLPYYGISAGPYSASTNAWTGYATFGLLLIFIATGIAAARVFAGAGLPKLPVGANLLVAALGGLGTLLVILRGFTYPHASFPGGSYGVKWGGYVLMLAGVVMTVFAVMNFLASGEKLAWDATAMNRGAAPNGTPQTGTYTAPSYPPPAPPAQPAPPVTDQPTPYPSGDPGSSGI